MSQLINGPWVNPDYVYFSLLLLSSKGQKTYNFRAWWIGGEFKQTVI